MRRFHFYTGTYYSKESLGIYEFALDPEEGKLREGRLALNMPQAKHIALNGSFLAAAYDDGDAAGVSLIYRNGRDLVKSSSVIQGKVAPCFTAFASNRLATANYHEGTVSLYSYRNGSLENEHIISIGAGAGCHQALIRGDLLLVPCLEEDCIRLFSLQQNYSPVGIIQFPRGCGPRHALYSPDGTRLWVVGERDNCLHCFRVDGEYSFIKEAVLNIVPAGAQQGSSSAAIRISPDGYYLTVSTRGANVLTTWKIKTESLEFVQQTSCGGDHPRDFIYTPDGHYLLCANRESGDIVCFSRDVQSGMLEKITDRIKIKQAVSLVCMEEIE